MKSQLTIINLDKNSTRQEHLYLRDVYVGDYSFGKFSKFMNTFKKANGEYIYAFDDYVCGRILADIKFPIETKDDVPKAENLIKEKFGMSIINYVDEIIFGEYL